METATIEARAARDLLRGAGEIAFLDVREHGQYGEGHPFFAVNLPYSRLEREAGALLPRRSVPILLLDDGDGVATRAARRLSALGYVDVKALAGGAPAWASAGFTLFKGVNVPSKAFGEIVEHELGTPSLTADELRRRTGAGEDLIVLDGRSPAEFRKMNLPGARCCPNAELGHRLTRLAPDPATTVVINCAGRTRSIIGAQSLRNQGVPNPVFALENGTQGWRLAGFELERGSLPAALPALESDDIEVSRARASDLRRRFRIPTIEPEVLALWQGDGAQSLYLFDVRSREEFDAGSLAAAAWAPGGQLVQATDQWVATRGARIVVADDTGLRASHTALWLRAMGHEAYVLEQDLSRCATAPERAGAPGIGVDLPTLRPEALAQRLAEGATLVDLSPGLDYRRGHPASAIWATRARLESAVAQLDRGRELVLADRDSGTAALAALDLGELGFTRLSRLSGGPDTWRAAGLEMAASPDRPSQADCIDHLFFVHDRHDDNLEASRRYLAWETGLVAQLSEDERSVFRMPGA